MFHDDLYLRYRALKAESKGPGYAIFLDQCLARPIGIVRPSQGAIHSGGHLQTVRMSRDMLASDGFP